MSGKPWASELRADGKDVLTLSETLGTHLSGLILGAGEHVQVASKISHLPRNRRQIILPGSWTREKPVSIRNLLPALTKQSLKVYGLRDLELKQSNPAHFQLMGRYPAGGTSGFLLAITQAENFRSVVRFSLSIKVNTVTMILGNAPCGRTCSSLLSALR